MTDHDNQIGWGEVVKVCLLLRKEILSKELERVLGIFFRIKRSGVSRFGLCDWCKTVIGAECKSNSPDTVFHKGISSPL